MQNSVLTPSHHSHLQRITKLLNATLLKFDKGALARWDNLLRDQQAKLEQVGRLLLSEYVSMS